MENWIETLVFRPLIVICVCVFVAACIVDSLIYLVSYERCCPTLYYKDSPFTRYLLAKMSPCLSRGFSVQMWCRNCHLQTFLRSNLCLDSPVYFEREYLSVRPDYGLVSLDWAIMPHYCKGERVCWKDDTPVLVIVPGAFGSTAHAFANACFQAGRRGFRPVVFNRRGWSSNPLSSPRLQTFGDPSDLRQVIVYIRAKYPSARLCAIGVSTGGGLLLSYLGEYGSSTHLSSAVLISAVWDAETVMESQQALYSCLWLQREKALLASHAGVLQKAVSFDKLLFSAKNMTQVEQTGYLPFSGTKDMNAYWEANSPLRDVDEIAIPVLALHSRDDPLVKSDTVPTELFTVYPNFLLVMTSKGGHAGFVRGMSQERPIWWIDLALEYTSHVLDFIAGRSHRRHPNAVGAFVKSNSDSFRLPRKISAK